VVWLIHRDICPTFNAASWCNHLLDLCAYPHCLFNSQLLPDTSIVQSWLNWRLLLVTKRARGVSTRAYDNLVWGSYLNFLYLGIVRKVRTLLIFPLWHVLRTFYCFKRFALRFWVLLLLSMLCWTWLDELSVLPMGSWRSNCRCSVLLIQKILKLNLDLWLRRSTRYLIVRNFGLLIVELLLRILMDMIVVARTFLRLYFELNALTSLLNSSLLSIIIRGACWAIGRTRMRSISALDMLLSIDNSFWILLYFDLWVAVNSAKSPSSRWIATWSGTSTACPLNITITNLLNVVVWRVVGRRHDVPARTCAHPALHDLSRSCLLRKVLGMRRLSCMVVPLLVLETCFLLLWQVSWDQMSSVVLVLVTLVLVTALWVHFRFRKQK